MCYEITCCHYAVWCLYFVQRIKSVMNWSGIFPFPSSGQTVRWAVAAVKGTVEICAVYAERMQDIQAQKQHSTRRPFSPDDWTWVSRRMWNINFYGAETWMLGKTYQKYLKSFDMRCERRIEKVSWTDRVRSDEVLQKVEEKSNILRKR